MTRARTAAVLLPALVLLPAIAAAYHPGSMFDRAAGGGGGGGLFYAGSPLERGWTCAACHVQPLASEVGIASIPPELLTTSRYVAGQPYAITVTLLNEQAGQGSPLANYNGIAAVFLDPAGTGAAAGSLSSPPGDFHARDANVIASAGQSPNETQWTFTWTAPSAGAGMISFFLGVVDGDGAKSPPAGTLTDPLGDGVFMFEAALQEDPGAGP